jgi:hypothetical protein
MSPILVTRALIISRIVNSLIDAGYSQEWGILALDSWKLAVYELCPVSPSFGGVVG